MGVNDNTDKANAGKDKIIGTAKNDDSDNENVMYDNNARQNSSSDVESFNEGMDWCHVLEYHEIFTKRNINRTVLEERIEEYILQEIAKEFNPSFNEDFFVSETATEINLGYASVTSESN